LAVFPTLRVVKTHPDHTPMNLFDFLLMRRLCRRPLTVAALLAASLGTALSASDYDAGAVVPPASVSAAGDFVVAVYSDALNLDPQAPAADGVGPGPGRLQAGCLSVVQLQLQSGSRELEEPARLTFGCEAVPNEARVFGWIDQRWQPVDARRDGRGRIEMRFKTLTTYAIFLPDPAPSQI
jgi:hypothetical protein